MRLLPAEKTIVFIILAVGIVDLFLLALKPVEVDVAGYLILIAVSCSLIGVGQFYRIYRNEHGISLATTGAGMFTLFTLVGSVFNYMLLPVPFARIDAALVRVDALFGYDWPAAVNWVAQYPLFAEILKYVYVSSLPQLVVVVLMLGFARQERQLHCFLLTGLFGALICVGVWSLFPSTGASGSDGALEALKPGFQVLVGPEYNAMVNKMIAEGARSISPSSALGLIGFPSFHTVMACMSVYYVPRYKSLVAVFVVVNLLMMSAVLIHGGHHLMDMIGGFAVFAIAMQLARKAVDQAEQARGPKNASAPAAVSAA